MFLVASRKFKLVRSLEFFKNINVFSNDKNKRRINNNLLQLFLHSNLILLDNSSALVPGVGGDPKSFFCHRNELVARAIDDVREFLTEDDPERVQGVWLLTECVTL